MDPEKKSIGFLNVLPNFGSKENNSNLSSKDKRYIQQVEKAIASFDSLEEWADYIAFLSRLQKSLQLTADEETWIPCSNQVSNKLSLCLSSRLPNGVHQKALTIYETIFHALSRHTLNQELQIWLPGLLPLFSYCSIQVKPQILKLYSYLLSNLEPKSIKTISKPLILSLLPGLDDENSEAFQETLELVDTFKTKLGDDSHFWQTMFLCIINNPERRLGALYWCNKRLPSFNTLKVGEEYQFSEEARACLTPEAGLLVRAFATSINTTTSFNPAGDIIVIRGFFDLLLSHIPLNSDILNKAVSVKDKELLLMACCHVTLRKDMSLNRRLWNWFLGPDTTDGDTSNNLTRSKYFENYGLDILIEGVIKLLGQNNYNTKAEAFRISLAVILDKWELSHLVTPRLLFPLLQECYREVQARGVENSKELLSSARAFFDGVETSYIWSDIIRKILLVRDASKLDFLAFLLKHFDFHEQEMVTIHIPLAILTLVSDVNLDPDWLRLLKSFVDLTEQNGFAPISEERYSVYTKDEIFTKLNAYYETLVKDETEGPPIQGPNLSFLCLHFVREMYISNIENTEISHQLCSLFCEFLYNIPNAYDVDPWKDKALITTILQRPISSADLPESEKQANLLNAFSFTKLLGYISKWLTSLEKSKLLKIILSNLWPALVSSSPANHQVEAVRQIFDLEIGFPRSHIEAGILNLLLGSSSNERVRAFSVLWTHSVTFNDADAFLVRPLQLLMDGLYEQDLQHSLPVVGFIESVSKSGTSNRFLKLLTNPLLGFSFMENKRDTITIKDDINQFSYYLKTVLNVIKANDKAVKEAFNTELVVMDNTQKIEIIRDNGWEISTYKTLMLSIAQSYIQLKVDNSILKDAKSMSHFYESMATALELVLILVTGNEPHFSEKFHILLSACSYYINLSPNNPYEIELIEKSFLRTIFKFLSISESLKINLNLLHIEDEGKEPLLVRFLTQGISKAQSSVLLESWFRLLTRSLYLFNESVFSVILTLNDAIIDKINVYFKKISTFEPFNTLVDVEPSFNILMSGLEDMLSISHSYLLTSKFKSMNTDKLNSPASESGFFGSVIQGVLQIESPAIRTTEQNKLYSILLAFQDAARVAFKIWRWADLKPQASENNTNVSDRSLTFLGQKLKFRSKKLLGSLMDLEKQEIIETLIEMDSPETIKLLSLFDGGRSQITLPYLFNAITTRADSSLLEEKQRSSMNVTISLRDLTRFLSDFMESIDNDSMIDIWDITAKFLKDATTHPSSFKSTFPSLLRAIKNLSIKVNISKSPEQRKQKRELSDYFVKVLNAALNQKSTTFTESASSGKPGDSTHEGSTRTINDSLVDTLIDLSDAFDEIIQDSDKVNTMATSITLNLLAPQVRSSDTAHTHPKINHLMKLIGELYPNRAWKTLVFDLFMDNNFFKNITENWNPIIRTWIINDKEKLAELVFRMTPSVQSTATNIFIWNEKSEVENKIFTLKRISYLIMVQPRDFFMSNLESIFEKIEYSLRISCPIAYRSELFNLFRAITLKFSEMHLLAYWTTIEQFLIAVFDAVLGKSLKELNSLTEEELQLVLSSCKLLDQLLLLKYDEFNLNEWLFVTSQPDVINGTNKNTLNALIDKIAAEVDPIVSKEPPIKVKQPGNPLSPLLKGVKNLKTIASLRTFFDSLSLISYERTYGLYEVDFDACKNAVFEDLLHFN